MGIQRAYLTDIADAIHFQHLLGIYYLSKQLNEVWIGLNNEIEIGLLTNASEKI